MMTGPAEDWLVQDPDGTTRTFVDKGPAHAVRNARSDRATIVVAPDGERTLVLRVDAKVEVHAVRRLTGPGVPA